MVREVKFVSDSTHSWDYVDVMVTDHPDVINSKPTDKICVMVEKEFNKELSNDYTIKTIKELSEVLKTIH